MMQIVSDANRRMARLAFNQMAVVACLTAVTAENARAAEIDRLPFLGGAWQFSATGKYAGWLDRRDLCVLHHPWEESDADMSGSVYCEFELPQNSSGPFNIHFYMTDDYDGQHPRLEDDSWLGQCNLIGHRFKQLLVNGTVVWERDVADAEGGDEPRQFAVELPRNLIPGEKIRIAFRMIDKRSSRDRDGQDFRHIGSTDNIDDSDPWRFLTNVYIGDVAITDAGTKSIPLGESPSVEKVRVRHEQGWPPKLLSPAVQFPITLQVEGTEGVPGEDRAIYCGIPFPQGRVKAIDRISLKDPSGKRLAAQFSEMNRWPDGSLRNVHISTLIDSRSNQVLLDVDEHASQAPKLDNRVAAKRLKSGSISLESGELSVVLDEPGKPFGAQVVREDRRLEDLCGVMEIDGKPVRAVVETAEVVFQGPVHGEAELKGSLSNDQGVIGRFVFRVAIFAGQPWVRISWRVFNDRAETLRVSRLELTGNIESASHIETFWSSSDRSGGSSVRIQQMRDDRFAVTADDGSVLEEGEAAGGWLGCRFEASTLLASVRHFREQYPKALEIAEGRLRISLFEASDDNPHYLPTEGEAKRHEIWIGLWSKKLSANEMAQHANAVARPPRLFDAKYYCETGALGRAAVHNSDEFSELDAHLKKAYPNVDAKRFSEYGIRNWGDQVYNQDEDYWTNGYYDRQQGFAAEYLMSGDPRWFDRLEAMVRHIIDVDICHASQQHPEWVGAIHGYNSKNHTDGPPWNPQQRTKGTLAYWRLSGDRDARDAALGVADSAIDARRGLGSQSVRDHAGILYCLTAAFDETGDQKYLKAAKAVAHDARGRMDPRRGCYSEIHGNVSYRGNVPWMCAQLAEPLYDYYCQSGDVEAAIGVVGLAESILTENRTRDVPGDVHGYSHNPHFNKTSSYHILIAPAVLYAYELTGDPYYLKHGRAMYRQTLRENTVNAITNCYWNTPTLLYYLKAWGLEDAEP